MPETLEILDTLSVVTIALLYGTETNLWLKDHGMQNSQIVHSAWQSTTVMTHADRACAIDYSSVSHNRGSTAP